MITEPKDESLKITIDNEHHKVSSVKDWWIRDKENSFIVHNPIIKSHPNIDALTERKTTTPTDQPMNTSQVLDHGKSNLDKRQPFIAMHKSSVDSKTSPESASPDGLDLSERSRSYDEHMKDVERDVNNHFIEEEKTDPKELLETCYIGKRKHSAPRDWWNQNLLLLIEIVEISVSVRKFKSGRQTSHVKDFFY